MSHPTTHVLTVVSATLPPEQAANVVAGFEALVQQPTPDGLLRSELLEGADGHWRIQTLWRDKAALEAMRAGSEPPAAPTLFRNLGGTPTLEVLDVRGHLSG